jgi:chromosome segregation ATPase
MSNELAVQERAVRIARVKMRGEQLATMEAQYVLVAAKTGEDLLWLKANCEHGEFKIEFAKEFPELNYPRATQWMKIAKEFPELLDDSKVAPVQLLEYTKIIELLNAPEEIKDAVIERVENGEDVSKREIQRLKKEADDLAKAKQTAEKELFNANEQLKEATAKVNFQKLTVDAINQQNDDLRNTITAQITAGVAEKLAVEREAMMQKNIDAIHAAEEKAKQAQSDLEKLKKEQAQAIKDGVKTELSKLDSEIRGKESVISMYQKDIEKLNKTKSELDLEVGALVTHNESIKTFKDYLLVLLGEFNNASDTHTIPIETLNDWKSIESALFDITNKVSAWLKNNSPSVNQGAIEGELVN